VVCGFPGDSSRFSRGGAVYAEPSRWGMVYLWRRQGGPESRKAAYVCLAILPRTPAPANGGDAMTYIGRKPCPGCPGLRPPYPPCFCIGVPDYGTQPLPSSPPWEPTYTPPPVTVPSIPVTPAPRGCVCPPTSEQTCQSPVCPRKPARQMKTGDDTP
jgi:hypothetical protein